MMKLNTLGQTWIDVNTIAGLVLEVGVPFKVQSPSSAFHVRCLRLAKYFLEKRYACYPEKVNGISSNWGSRIDTRCYFRNSRYRPGN